MPSRRRKLGWLKWAVILALAIAVVIVAVLVMSNVSRSDGNDGADQGVKTAQEGGDDKNIKGMETQVVEPEEKKEVPQYEGSSPNQNDELTGVITYAAVNGNDLVVRVNIDQFLSGGTCELELTRDGQELYRESVQIIDNVTTSTCEGFNVAVGEMAYGKTQITVMLSSSGKSGKIVGEVEL